MKEKNTFNIYLGIDEIACILFSAKPIDGKGYWKWEEVKNNFREVLSHKCFSDVDKRNKVLNRFNQICSG